jgi:hypothetical protein
MDENQNKPSINTIPQEATEPTKETETPIEPLSFSSESETKPEEKEEPSSDVSTTNKDTNLYDKTATPTPEDPTPEGPTPEDPTPEDPTPEDPTPEGPKDPTPEGPKDPTPEGPKDPTPEDPKDPITEEDLQELQEREMSLRSKILNQPPPCKKKQTTPTPYIERIQVKTPLTENEATISRQIKEQCPQAFLYFQPLVETSPLQINTITECEEGTEQPSNPTDELIETKYKKTTTQSLTPFLQSQINPPQKQKNKFIQLLVHTHLQLLRSIQKLQQLTPPIIHFHLTPETLQYNAIDAIPVITDFRLAFTKTMLEDPNETEDLFPPYENNPQYPFEVFLLSKIANLPDKDTPLEATTLAQISEAFAQQQQQQQQPKETTPKDMISKAIAHHLTWDPYAIHYYIYSFMTTYGIPIDKPFMTQYKDLLVSYLTCEPSKRPSIEATQESIKNIFKSVPKKDYLGFISSLPSM